MTRSKRRALVVAVALLVLVPTTAIAASSFTDVPDDSVFSAHIEWMAENEITLGCNPPTNDRYCPSDNVTREQMAAFMHRLALAQVVDAATVEGMTAEDLKGDVGDKGDKGDKGDPGEPGPISDLTFDGHVLSPAFPDSELIHVPEEPVSASSGLCVGYDRRNHSVFGSLTVPVGATLEGFTATWYDAADADVQIAVWKRASGTFNLESVAVVSSSGNAGLGTTTSSTLNEVVDPGEHFLVSFIFPSAVEDLDLAGLCGVELHLK